MSTKNGHGRLSDEKRLIILGSTGSIGVQTVEVVNHLNALHASGEWPVRYRVVGLAAGSRAGELFAQAQALGTKHVALSNAARAIDGPTGVKVLTGMDAPERLVREVECDVVVGAMVGSAGLPATMAAIELGRDVALANKETLVAAGSLVIPAALASGSKLLPVDSEHCALWECLHACGHEQAARSGRDGHQWSCPPMTCSREVSKLVLTASGGSFRTLDKESTYFATPAQALKHPTWSMGPKVTVDSASLTNKALEIVEAHWLFGVPGEKIDVLVHPQSIVHALVEFADGNVVAQLAPPDMRTPIQYALTFPHRPKGIGRTLEWAKMRSLEFSPPDVERFPALLCAYEIIRHGGTSGAVFNAANEEAVEAFLRNEIPFGRIGELSRGALNALGSSRLRTLDDVHEADKAARAMVRSELSAGSRVQQTTSPGRT